MNINELSMTMDRGSIGDIPLKMKGVELEEFDHRKMKEMELGLKENELQSIKTLGMDFWG